MKVYNPDNLPTIDYRKVRPFQGNLKSLHSDQYQKLKKILNDRGFRVPLFIWKNEGENYLLDGHQRVFVMTQEDMNNEGSYEVPYVNIYADDIAEAKAQLLEITSQYGRITYEGLDQYLAESVLEEAEVYETVNFDALPLLGTEINSEDDSEEDDERPTQPTIYLKFPTTADRDACMAELSDIDIYTKFDAKAKVA